MKNVKLTKTLNIEIGGRKLTFSEDEAFDLYSALAKVFGPLGDDDCTEDEEDDDEIEKETDEEELPKANDLFKRIQEIAEELEKRNNIGNPFPSFPKSTPWYDPQDIPKFPQTWCTITHESK